MLSGKELGRAIEQAIDKKLSIGSAKSKAEIARHFKIKPHQSTIGSIKAPYRKKNYQSFGITFLMLWALSTGD
jgi:hypothetical protein